MMRKILVPLSAVLALAAAPAAAQGVVRGTVWDSTAARPLAGARVYLVGTTAQAESAADGGFALTSPGEGRYILAFSHPGLGPLATAVRNDTVTLTRGDTVTVALAVPAWRTVLPLLCPDSTLRHEPGVVLGRVSGPGAAQATVTGTWWGKSYSAGDGSSFTRGTVTTHADEDGAYVLCGVTTQGEVKVRAESSSARGETATRSRGGRPARADVELREGTG